MRQFVLTAVLLVLPGVAPAGSVTVGRLPEHPGHYDTRSELILSEPIGYYGLMVERVGVDQEWECVRREHRVVRLSYYTQSGRYVRSEPIREPWRAVDGQGPLRPSLDQVCAGGLPDAAALPGLVTPLLERGIGRAN